MPTSIAVVPVIETTSVMEQFGFVSAASINALAFVGDPLRNDALGMISFDAAGVQSYAPGGRLSTVDGTLPQPAAANDAPTSPSVNIGGGLRTAYSLLANAPGGLTTGALLLSTGQQDSGTDPATLSRYVPTWVCALGPTANTALLRQISLLSHGQYLYVPTPADISAAVNQIRGQLPGWTTLLNQSKAVEARGFWLQPVTIAPGCSAAQFSVVWENPHLTCTSSSNPGPNQISVTLVQPPGITLATPPSACGGGYCVFNVRDPVSSPGPWYVQVMYPDGATLPIAIGVFGQYGDAGVKLEIVPSGSPRAGHALVAQVKASHPDQSLRITCASVEVTEPRISLRQLMRAHDIQGEDALKRLHARRRSLLAGGDIFQHTRRQSPLRLAGDHPLRAQLTAAAVPGSLNAKVTVKGRLAGSGAQFERSELVSFVVEDSPDY